jgi:hypothetical protein
MYLYMDVQMQSNYERTKDQIKRIDGSESFLMLAMETIQYTKHAILPLERQKNACIFYHKETSSVLF